MGEREIRDAAIKAATEVDPRFDRIADLAWAEQRVADVPEVHAEAERRVAEVRDRTEERIAKLRSDEQARVEAIQLETDTEVAKRRIAHHVAWAEARKFWKPAVLRTLNHRPPVGRRPSLPHEAGPDSASIEAPAQLDDQDDLAAVAPAPDEISE